MVFIDLSHIFGWFFDQEADMIFEPCGITKGQTSNHTERYLKWAENNNFKSEHLIKVTCIKSELKIITKVN